jgi:hypothetical protein
MVVSLLAQVLLGLAVDPEVVTFTKGLSKKLLKKRTEMKKPSTMVQANTLSSKLNMIAQALSNSFNSAILSRRKSRVSVWRVSPS